MSIALIHPMLVHFPIVFLISAVAMDIISLSIKKNLASREGLPLISLSALLLGTLSAAPGRARLPSAARRIRTAGR